VADDVRDQLAVNDFGGLKIRIRRTSRAQEFDDALRSGRTSAAFADRKYHSIANP
jgi:hypothetical protein